MQQKIKHVFTQDEAEEMYTMLHTLVYALQDIKTNGLTIHSITQVGENLAHLLASLERVVFQAEKLLTKIDKSPAPAVQEIENKYIRKQEPVMTCPNCKTDMYVEYAVCPNCGANLNERKAE